VYACHGTTTGATTFDSPGSGVYAWQCVELSARYLWAIDGVWAGPGSGVSDGADLVSVVHAHNPSIAVGSPGPGNVPLPGDVISLGPGGGTAGSAGHTAVVIAATASTGSFTVMSENAPEGTAGEQTLQVDLSGAHNGQVEFYGAWTTASWLDTGNSGPPTTPKVAVTARSSTAIGLSWDASNATSYRVVRNGRQVGTTASLAYTDTTVRPTTFYRYRVVAVGAAGQTATSATVTVASSPPPRLHTDVAGDGRDALVYIYPGATIDTFLPTSGGAFREVQQPLGAFDTTGGLWTSGDMTGNGRDDLVYIYPGATIDTFLSNGDGTYTERQQALPHFDATGGTWEVADVTGNGRDDLVYVYPGATIDTFLSNGDGTYSEKQDRLSGFDSVTGQWEVADVTGNGRDDLVYVYPGATIDTFLSNANGTYTEKQDSLSGFDSVTGLWFTGRRAATAKDSLFYVYPGATIDTFTKGVGGVYGEQHDSLSGFDSVTGLWVP
jgi:hypothetical protein